MNKARVLFMLVTTLTMLSVPLLAFSQSQPFYGLPLPGPATLQVLDFGGVDLAPIPVVRTHDSQPIPDGEALHSHVAAAVDIALESRERNPQMWGIFSGFPEEEKVFSYMHEHLEQAGVEDIDVQTLNQNPYSLTTGWRVQLTGLDGESVDLQSATAMGVGARESMDAVTAPLIYLGRGLEADLAGRDVAGNIAVIRATTAPPFFETYTRGSMARLAAARAVGVIRLWDHPGNLQVRLGNCPDIPCFELGQEDGSFLEAVMVKASAAGEMGQLRMSLEIDIEREVRQARNLVGKIEGTQNSEENIILLAHADTWFAGAEDNGAGLAMLLGLAEHFGANRPRHDVYFVVSPGHHHGAVGSNFFVENYTEVVANNMLTVNLEHIAAGGITRSYAGTFRRERDAYGNQFPRLVPTNWDAQWRISTMTSKTPFLVDAWHRASNSSYYSQSADIWETGPNSFPGEAGALARAGVNGVQNVEVDHWYHTSGATADTISSESLARAFLFFTDFLAIVDQASRAEIEAE